MSNWELLSPGIPTLAIVVATVVAAILDHRHFDRIDLILERIEKLLAARK